ncbi:AMP-binding protein (plasmid) [Leisingera aquaemixtae]|uniref:AMP-binding protein n=1 Tax=Leisingera aquaemixtae TaxID=1396826 RepID=UPI0021A8DA7E|nr:AMP-binding protein [Leisingera aquaemixtae]UWQ26937.1 AMP-binding protein [Leisingera aquaemixtae]UWQ47864.1 AMP-binding protein [Leisingera aquaemixtae]
MFFDLENLRAFGPRPCLETAGGPGLSYAALADAAAQFAALLPQDRQLIAVEAAADPEAITAYLGVLAAGHAVMPLPAGEEATAARLEERFRPAASFRRLGGAWQLLAHAHEPAALHPELALLLQTSGSTGHGRGVRLSRAAVYANARAIADYLEIRPEDRAALILPLHYSYGLSVLHSHLAAGASLWLAPGSVLDAGFATALEASGATSLAGVPHHFRLLESAGLSHALPESIKTLTVAGGAMEPDQVSAWASRMQARAGRFFVMYGQTEATARISYLPPEEALANPGAAGRAIPGGRLLLRDAGGTEITAPEGEGELVYQGPNVMMGYAEDSAGLARGAELSELATGDLARRDANGLYHITGRLSRMSKIAGLRIGHDAIERALAAQGHEAAVWGDDARISIAVCGPQDGIAALAARLTGVGQQHFTVIPRASLPRRANGKIDYPALKAQCAKPEPAKGVLAAYQAAFAPQTVGRNDSFASLGGDSLRHVELSLALDEALGGAPAGWEDMPVKDLEQAAPAPSASLPFDLVARVVAILAVVTAHQTFWPVYGGAAAMVILMGMSVAGFRWDALASGSMRSFFKPVAAVLIPYYLILAGYAVAWEQVPWASVFLAGNFAVTTPETHLMLPYLYWFIEAYLQMTLLAALPFALPPVRRWLVQQGAFRTGLCFLGFAVAIRLIAPEIWQIGGRAQFTVPWVFYLFALGWCITAANTLGQRLLVLGAACVIMPAAAYFGGNWYGGWIKYMWLLALIAGLLFISRLPVPRFAARPLMRLAQAAFPIYLLHRFVPELLMPMIGLEGRSPLNDALAIFGGIALGLAAAALQRQLVQAWSNARNRPEQAMVEA